MVAPIGPVRDRGIPGLQTRQRGQHAEFKSDRTMSNEKSKLTIREVATAAGVSRMTVTRVMRRVPLVAPKTRAAVEEVISRLGYEPMQAARNSCVPLGPNRIQRAAIPMRLA